jgi:hypothetical protein
MYQALMTLITWAEGGYCSLSWDQGRHRWIPHWHCRCGKIRELTVEEYREIVGLTGHPLG